MSDLENTNFKYTPILIKNTTEFNNITTKEVGQHYHIIDEHKEIVIGLDGQPVHTMDGTKYISGDNIEIIDNKINVIENNNVPDIITPFKMNEICKNMDLSKFIVEDDLVVSEVLEKKNIDNDEIKYILNPLNVRDNLRAITYGNGLYVVVGENGLIIASPDLENWTKIEHPTPSSKTDVIDITYIDNKFFIISNNIVYVSSDLQSWDVFYSRNSTSSNRIRKIKIIDNYLYIIARSDIIKSSLDINQDFEFLVSSSMSGAFTSIAYNPNNNVFVLSSDYVNASFTTDNFKSITSTSKSPNLPNLKPSYDIIYANNQFIICFVGGIIYRSLDGINWEKTNYSEQIGDGLGYALMSIAYGNNKYVTVGSYFLGILKSIDGINWTSTPMDINIGLLNDVEYINNRFVAVGYNGTILVFK